MDPTAIIESYVGDVVRHLPRRQRNDVGFELRSLLSEELDGRTGDTGRTADAAVAMELLTAFGRPQDVADRYRPAGFTVIRPADAPRFAWIALGGVVLHWALTLPTVFIAATPGDEWPGRLTAWWLSWGLGAFWWPGFLISMTLIAALLSHRRGEARPWAPARVIDRDAVNRPASVIGIAFAVLGASLMTALPFIASWAPGLPQPLIDALALDPEFLGWRAPWVLPLWAGSIALTIAVTVAGRWSRDTRMVGLGLDLVWLLLLVWWIAAGPIMVSDVADDVAKLCLAGIAIIVVIDGIATIRRNVRFSAPA